MFTLKLYLVFILEFHAHFNSAAIFPLPVHSWPPLIAPFPDHLGLENWYHLTSGYQTRHVQMLMVKEHTCLLSQLHVQQQSQTLHEQSSVDANTAQNRVWPQRASRRMQETNFCLLLSLRIQNLHVRLPHTCAKLVNLLHVTQQWLFSKGNWRPQWKVNSCPSLHLQFMRFV